MPIYQFVAKDIRGKTVKGSLEATDAEALTAALKERRCFLISYQVKAGQTKDRRMRPKDLAEFNRQIGTMLSSGISLLRALEIILRRDLSKKHRGVYEKMYSELLVGTPLSYAMQRQDRVFPPLLINMYRAGEANGTIDLTANRMADHFEKEYRLRNKLKSASTYPIVLLALTLVIMVLVFTVVLPQFVNLYGGMELPGITRAVLWLAELFTDRLLYLILAAALLTVLFKLVFSIPGVRVARDRLKLRLPIVGRLMRIIVTARFSRTLSSLYASGLPILTALDISRGTVDNAYIAGQFDQLINDVRTGAPLSDALDKVDGFDKKLSATVSIGEESGRLEAMLISVADSFDYEANEASQRLVAILEPVLICLMALIIGAIMVAVMLPIYGMYDQIGANYGL